MAYYPGTGLGPEWQGTYTLCDFRGSGSGSGPGAAMPSLAALRSGLVALPAVAEADGGTSSRTNTRVTTGDSFID